MSVYIVDASVAVKWFLPEPYTDAALRLCQPDHQLHVPALFDLKFSNIVCKKIRRSELTLEEGYEMRRDIFKVPVGASLLANSAGLPATTPFASKLAPTPGRGRGQQSSEFLSFREELRTPLPETRSSRGASRGGSGGARRSGR